MDEKSSKEDLVAQIETYIIDGGVNAKAQQFAERWPETRSSIAKMIELTSELGLVHLLSKGSLETALVVGDAISEAHRLNQ